MAASEIPVYCCIRLSPTGTTEASSHGPEVGGDGAGAFVAGVDGKSLHNYN